MKMLLSPRLSTPSPLLLRVGIALVTLTIALGLSLLFRPLIEPTPFVLFFAAIAIIAAYSGFIISLLSALCSAVLVNYFLVSTAGSFNINEGDVIRGIVFLFVAALISFLSTSRQNAALQAYAQAERLAVTLASIGDAVIATDANGTITFMNSVAEQLTGWERNQAEGKKITEVFQVIHAETREPALSPVARVLHDEATGTASHTLLRAKDGIERAIDDSSAPIRATHGKLLGVVVVFRDVSMRIEADAALQGAYDQLATILDNIADGVLAELPSGRLIYVNEAAAKMTGYSSAQALMVANPEERARRFVLMDENENVLLREQLPSRQAFQGIDEPEQVVYYRNTASGEARWVLIQARPVRNAQGHIILAISIIHDITEQKQAEAERLQLLEREQSARAEAETAKRQATFLADAGRLLSGSLDYPTTLRAVAQLAVPSLADWCTIHLLDAHQNVQLIAMAHVDPAKEPLIDKLFHSYPPSLAANTGIGAVLHTGQTILLPEITAETFRDIAPHTEQQEPLHSLGIVSAMIVPLIARGHTLAALMLVSASAGHMYGQDDVSFAEALAQRAAKAIDNAQLYQQTEQAVRLREQFLSIAAHELKTPLTSLMGQAQLLQRRANREGFLGPRDQHTLHIINNQISRLNRMVMALLDTARIETGQLSIEHARLDIVALTRRAVEELQTAHENRTVEFHTQLETAIISGDALRLEQVIQNLIQNALKYSTEPSPVTVTVCTEPNWVNIAVHDQGMGIPEAALPNLFQRFFRADNAEAQHISGLGIGLYVVKEIVTLHGGIIAVESTEGSGSTFTVRLPLATPEPVT